MNRTGLRRQFLVAFLRVAGHADGAQQCAVRVTDQHAAAFGEYPVL